MMRMLHSENRFQASFARRYQTKVWGGQMVANALAYYTLVSIKRFLAHVSDG
jgi:hypothetical protein